jgi:hypothetical protein
MTAVTVQLGESRQARSRTRRSLDPDLRNHCATVCHSLKAHCPPLLVPIRSQTWRLRFPSRILDLYQTSSEMDGICCNWRRCSSRCITQLHSGLARGKIQQGISTGVASHGYLDREWKQREATRILLASRTGHWSVFWAQLPCLLSFEVSEIAHQPLTGHLLATISRMGSKLRINEGHHQKVMTRSQSSHC